MSQAHQHNEVSDDLSFESRCVLQILEEYTQRQENGESPTISEYEKAYPRIAGRIRETLMSMDVMANAMSVNRPLPQQIGGCQILREVGKGATGTVYEAMHPSVSRRLAIKVLDTGNSDERFLREAEVLSRLNHPNIVPFMDYGVEGQMTYLSMHYIDGVSIDKVLDAHWGGKGLKTEGDCETPDLATEFAHLVNNDYQKLAALGASVASALDYAHSQQVVHRDVKPGNLILDRQGDIWVTDFGLAKAILDGEDSNLTKDAIGTPRYMAPEQIRGASSHQSDIYSLGTTLYELASGKRAWDTISQRTLIIARPGLELPDLSQIAPEVPSALAKIIMKACSLKPEDRYETAAELENVLTRFAETGRQGDRRNNDRYEGQTYVRRRPLWIGGSFIAACLMIGLLWPTGNVTNASDTYDVSLTDARRQRAVREQILKNLPDRNGHDTKEAKDFRQMVVTETVETLNAIWEDAELPEEDRRALNRVSDKVSEAFVDGKVTREEFKERFVDGEKIDIKKGIRSLEKDINRAGFNKQERQTAMRHLQKARKSVASGEINEKNAEQKLNEMLPGFEKELKEAADTARGIRAHNSRRRNR